MLCIRGQVMGGPWVKAQGFVIASRAAFLQDREDTAVPLTSAFVLQDMVNRRIAMDMILKMADSQRFRQFILLTPQSMR